MQQNVSIDTFQQIVNRLDAGRRMFFGTKASPAPCRLVLHNRHSEKDMKS